jgi:Bax protein
MPMRPGPGDEAGPGGPVAADDGIAARDPADRKPLVARLRALDLARLRSGVQPVPRGAVHDLPPALDDIERADGRKRLFVKSLLPGILKANAEVRRQRDFLQTLKALEIPRPELPAEMRTRLERLERRYEVEPGRLETLLRRVDTVPPALILAQGAIETGWGTSRFAQEGNAIFGQHTRDPEDDGMVPRGIDDPDFRVRAFDTIEAAVAAYLHNLNTHAAYAKLRAVRAKARDRGARPSARAMAAGLVDYSARGWAYVEDVRVTIEANRFDQYAEARLRPEPSRLVDAGQTAAPR